MNQRDQYQHNWIAAYSSPIKINYKNEQDFKQKDIYFINR